jgi:hypothetical protein
MSVTWTATQKQRLSELDADEALHEQVFADTAEREEHFKQLERKLLPAGIRKFMSRYLLWEEAVNDAG